MSVSQRQDMISSMSDCISRSIGLSRSTVLPPPSPLTPRNCCSSPAKKYTLVVSLLDYIIRNGWTCLPLYSTTVYMLVYSSPMSSGMAPCSCKSMCTTSSPELHTLNSRRRQYLSWARLEPRPPIPWKLFP